MSVLSDLCPVASTGSFRPEDPALPYALLGPNDRKVLAELGESKKVVGIVVRAKNVFFEDVRGLAEGKPENAALVAVVPRTCLRIEENEKVFDWIIYYDNSGCVYRELKTTNHVSYPELHKLGQELVELIPKEKIQLIHTEERTITELCRIRERHGLQAYPKDVDGMCRKELLAKIAQNSEIPVAKTVFLEFTQIHDTTQLLNKVKLEIGAFPMFAKPNRMSGSAGIAKITTIEQLEKWIVERSTDEVPVDYVIQEFVEGKHFGVTVLLLPDGTSEVLFVYHLLGSTAQETILKGKPLVVAGLNPAAAFNGKFPNLDKFSQKVVNAFQPVFPQILFIQGFQLTPGADQYVLNELNYRPNGDRSMTVSYHSCGISLYTALILAHLDPHYQPKTYPGWKPQTATLIAYPFRRGVLRSHNDESLRENVRSNCMVEWCQKPGVHMTNPLHISDMLVKILLYSKTERDRDADVEWICSEWNPDVV
ncbi:hypothetical protein L596_020622 [Steinernema carpocapsae]|uniref:ATP-grasp domain-containing protein n=1 Tax=Steinernema carpocapsae TaxID=34508 RepID=A0A4U5MU31_STECR|nr:hypothetical protein L596_020622 [Steinernema carpocapsae]